MKMAPPHWAGYNGMARLTRLIGAVTGATMAIEMRKLKEIGFFNEKYPINFNDTVACLEANRKGYRNLYLATTELQHAEGTSRSYMFVEDGGKHLRDDVKRLFAEYREKDEFWNDSLEIGTHPSGMMGIGFNYDTLNWDKEKRPKNAKRILLIDGSPQEVVREFRSGKIVLNAISNGPVLRLINPMMESLPGINLSDMDGSIKIMQTLGIDEIVAGEGAANKEALWIVGENLSKASA